MGMRLRLNSLVVHLPEGDGSGQLLCVLTQQPSGQHRVSPHTDTCQLNIPIDILFTTTGRYATKFYGNPKLDME